MFRADLKTYPFLASLIVLALVGGFVGLGRVPLTDVDEGVFSEASREMLEQGNWVTPTYNYRPRYDKPILFYWLQAGSFALLGVNEYAARFPSALATLVLTVCLYLFARRHLGGRAAMWGTAAWLLSVETFVYGRAAVTDMTLCMFMFGSLAGMFNYLQNTDRKIWLRVAYGSAALAFLTKGLVGIVFPVGIIVLYTLLQGRFHPRQWWDAGGVLLFLAVAAPWYVLQTLRDGGAFLGAFFLKHHVERYTGVVSGHEGPWYYFIAVLAVGFFPWIGFVPAGLRAAIRSRSAELARYAAVWFCFVVIFFSFSGTKLPNYIMSALPAGGILAGIGIDILLERRGGAEVRVGAGIVALVGLLLCGAAGYLWYKIAPAGYPTGGVAAVFFLLAATVLWSAAVLVRGSLGRPRLVAAAMAGVLGVAALQVLPMALGVLQGELKAYAVEARAADPAGRDHLVLYRINKPSLAFYYGGKTEKAWDVAGAWRFVGGGRSARIVASADAKVREELVGGGFRVERQGNVFSMFVPDKRPAPGLP